MNSVDAVTDRTSDQAGSAQPSVWRLLSLAVSARFCSETTAVVSRPTTSGDGQRETVWVSWRALPRPEPLSTKISQFCSVVPCACLPGLADMSHERAPSHG